MPSRLSSVANSKKKFLRSSASPSSRGVSKAEDRLLCQAHGDGRLCRHRLSKLHRLVKVLTLGDDAIHQAEVRHLLCADLRACQHNLHRAIFAERTSQPLGSARAGNNTEQNFGLSKACILRGDDYVAVHRELA